MEEQERRFRARITDPRKLWKLSPMDVESYKRWYDYSRARDAMLKATDTEVAPWHIVQSDDKKRARLNCISHLLSQIPYKDVTPEPVKLGKRNTKGKYNDQPSMAKRRFVPSVYRQRQCAGCQRRKDDLVCHAVSVGGTLSTTSARR
jgi:hypothetical protein